MKVPFPKATVYQNHSTSEIAPLEIETDDGPLIFLAFEDWKKAVAFCRRNHKAGLQLSPIRLDRGREQFKEVFRRHCTAPGNEESFFIIDPDTLWDEEVTVVSADHLLAAQGNQLEARRCHLEWPAAEPLTCHRGDTMVEVDFFHTAGGKKRRIGKVAFFALPLEDRNGFSCIPEHLITFDEAKWIASELKRGGNAGQVRYYLWSIRPATQNGNG